MKRTMRVLLVVFSGLLGLCVMASAISALSNRSLLAQYAVTGAAPAPPSVSPPWTRPGWPKTLQLKTTLGDQIWPGWGRTEIPVILWTAGVEFLTGVSRTSRPRGRIGRGDLAAGAR